MLALDCVGENSELVHDMPLVYQERRRCSGCYMSVDTAQSTSCLAGAIPRPGFVKHWPVPAISALCGVCKGAGGYWYVLLDEVSETPCSLDMNTF